MEGSSGATLTVYDEAALCSSTFKILRGMVHTWMNEVSSHGNFFADLQLQHFYRCAHVCGCLIEKGSKYIVYVLHMVYTDMVMVWYYSCNELISLKQNYTIYYTMSG